MNRIFTLSLLLCLLYSCSKETSEKEVLEKNIFYDQAFDFRENNQTDSAFFYFDQAKDLFLLQDDSLGVAKSFLNMAIISTDNGDYFGGQELSLNAENYFDHSRDNQKVYISSNYNNLGIATLRLRNYQKAIYFYERAIKYSTDPASSKLYLNNKANVYQTAGNFGKAIEIYEELLNDNTQNKKEYARVLSNIAKTKWLQNPKYDAKQQFLQALNIRKKERDFWGLNASYAHLADYYYSKNRDSASYYALKMYNAAIKISSEDDQVQALEKLIKLSPMEESKAYFDRFQSINDSLGAARNNAKEQFALIRYETEKNKTQNFELKQDNTKKEYQIFKREILLYALILFAILSVVIAIIWYKKRKDRLRAEVESLIKESQLKTSKRVHDVVANGLYRVMTELDSLNLDVIEPMMDKIEDLYEKSRDISYEDYRFSTTDFTHSIAALITSFANEKLKVALVGNTDELWDKVNSEVKYELHHILQELMVNMKKHSAASHVAVRFEQIEKQVSIRYTDNGIGMKQVTKFNNGLTNTGNRIKTIKGSINFDVSFEKGLRILIAFPIA